LLFTHERGFRVLIVVGIIFDVVLVMYLMVFKAREAQCPVLERDLGDKLSHKAIYQSFHTYRHFSDKAASLVTAARTGEV
jgi:hypothetical protein